ncbi:MAG: radical SAM protein [Gemmatimonadaceae bacterium]|nr:radical SAM protein [Gemmatimonadaceae bacterium]
MGTRPVLAAALAGIPIGIQRHGQWAGRRQLLIKFAGPAETATMYTSDALAREVGRALSRSPVHSICISGRDALGNAEFLEAALQALATNTPVVADTDGQRPEAIAVLHAYLSLVQVSIDTPASEATVERAMETVRAAARVGCAQAVVIGGTDEASDADYLQIVEKAHAASEKVRLLIHPGPATERGVLDRRWAVLLEHAMGRHADVQIALRLSGPATLR